MQCELRIDVSRIDPAALTAALDQAARQDVCITTLADELARGRRALERIHAVHDECYRRQPATHFVRASIPFNLWRWASLSGRDALPDGYFVAKDGERYAGVAAPLRASRLPGVLVSHFTGVLPAYQGRGIGRALKASVLRYAVEQGYREVRCSVLDANLPMLAINLSLGFEVVEAPARAARGWRSAVADASR